MQVVLHQKAYFIVEMQQTKTYQLSNYSKLIKNLLQVKNDDKKHFVSKHLLIKQQNQVFYVLKYY